MSFIYEYPRAANSTDCVVLGVAAVGLEVLLIRRKNRPFVGKWALPGGFLEIDEGLEACARRELREETGAEVGVMWQLGAFGDVDRDPRYRVISVVFIALVHGENLALRPGDDAAEAAWFPVRKLPSLAFDHERIVAAARARIRDIALSEPVGADFLPERFPLSELKRIYESILERQIDADVFRRAMRKTGILKAEPQGKKDARPLYRFDRKQYEKAARQGFAHLLFPRWHSKSRQSPR